MDDLDKQIIKELYLQYGTVEKALTEYVKLYILG